MKPIHLFFGFIFFALPGTLCGCGVASRRWFGEATYLAIFPPLLYISVAALALQPILTRFFHYFVIKGYYHEQKGCALLFLVCVLYAQAESLLSRFKINDYWRSQIFTFLGVFFLTLSIFLLVAHLYFADPVMFQTPLTLTKTNDPVPLPVDNYKSPVFPLYRPRPPRSASCSDVREGMTVTDPQILYAETAKPVDPYPPERVVVTEHKITSPVSAPPVPMLKENPSLVIPDVQSPRLSPSDVLGSSLEGFLKLRAEHRDTMKIHDADNKLDLRYGDLSLFTEVALNAHNLTRPLTPVPAASTVTSNFSETTKGSGEEEKKLEKAASFVSADGHTVWYKLKEFGWGKIGLAWVPFCTFVGLDLGWDFLGWQVSRAEQIASVCALMIVQAVLFKFIVLRGVLTTDHVWVSRTVALLCLPILSIFMLYAVQAYCYWLVVETTQNATSSIVLVVLHLLISFIFQSFIERIIAWTTHPWLFANLQFLCQLTSTLPQYILLSQTPWSLEFVLGTVISAVHSALAAAQVYKHWLRSLVKRLCPTIIITEQEWAKSLRHEHSLRLFGQAALCEIWSIVTIILTNTIAYSLLAGADSPSYDRLKDRGWIVSEEGDLWNDMLRLAVLFAAKLTAFTFAQCVIFHRFQNRVYDPTALSAYLKNKQDPFDNEEILRCVQLDYPEHTLDPVVTQNNPGYFCRVFVNLYALSAMLFLLFGVLSDTRDPLRLAWYY